MWNFRRGIKLLNFSYVIGAHLNSVSFRKTQFVESIVGVSSNLVLENLTSALVSSTRVSFFCSSNFNCSSINGGLKDGLNAREDDYDDDSDGELVSEDDGEAKTVLLGVKDESFNSDVQVILRILRGVGSKFSSAEQSCDNTQEVMSGTEVRNRLNQCGVSLSSDLVAEVLSRIRNDWEAAFTFFLWVGKQPGYAHTLRECHSMISILAKKRKFDTAWSLIDEMRRGGLVIPDTLLIMIRRYCAVHDVGSAINTFHAFKRFKFQVGMEEFQKFLSALARYKNVQDAEHLLFSNKNTFPFNTKSFNIILNGWSNVVGSPREAKRFWKVMIDLGIKRDVVSYSSIISSYSKSNKLKDVLRLFDEMKRMGIAPDTKVYNAVIYAVAKAGHYKEALNLLKTMENGGISPNAVTYNSLIKPFVRARRRDDAQRVFNEMLDRGLQPTIRTYHALLRVQWTGEDIFMLLNKMRQTGCPPNKDTYIMLIRKFCRWRQLDNVFKLWDEMNEMGMNDDRSSYIVLIHGLFLNGKFEEANCIYLEMKEKSLLPDKKTDEWIQTWLSNKQMTESETTISESSTMERNQDFRNTRPSARKFEQNEDLPKHPEMRKVVRERGFSFWER